MPMYDFVCQKCSEPFMLFITITEHDKGGFKCPKCSSTNVEQQISPIQILKRWSPTEDGRDNKKIYRKRKKKLASKSS